MSSLFSLCPSLVLVSKTSLSLGAKNLETGPIHSEASTISDEWEFEDHI